ncbi:MAG: hypothetical protein US93_C0008G0057 [Candidatus Falkowbacteria bacterium GW2011_GWD2_38_42]|nr:MAG: hypothetical protein US93_C0008G0057 [Candidatus Falkowbacteria bacterium GW2011_GWD2_38_42]
MKEKRFFSLIVFLFALMSIIACDSMTTVVQKSKDLQKNGRYEDSIVILEKETAKKPNNRDANYLLGVAYLNTGRFESAHRIFTTAVETKEDVEQKARLKKEIAKEYRETFYRYLANVNPSDRQKAGMLLKAALAYNSVPEFIDRIKNHLKENGMQYLNKHTLERADEHFDYLYSLDKGSGKVITEAYLSAFKQGGEDDYLTLLVEQAISYNDDTETKKTYSEYYFGLSRKAETTEKAIAYLETANKHGNLFASELAIKKEQLKEEQFKYEAEFGPAQEIKLTEKGKWLLACAIPDDSMIYYLSLNDFKKRDNVNKEKIWPASSPQKYTRYNIWGSEKLNNDKPAHIFYWPRKS